MINKEKDKNPKPKKGLVEVARGVVHGRLVIKDKETGQIIRNEKG